MIYHIISEREHCLLVVILEITITISLWAKDSMDGMMLFALFFYVRRVGTAQMATERLMPSCSQ
jgi:hypothetical protein